MFIRDEDKYKIEIGTTVIDEAQEIFETCRAKDDFCIQSVGTNVVFGSINRLIWNPVRGFRPDRTHCTERFLREWDAYYWGK